MEFPIAGITANPWLLVLTGFTVGVCGGFFGVGGAFIATPALNILGFPMAYAIGTDMAHIMGKSLMSSALHRRLGNVDVRAGLLMVLGTVPGIELGAQAVMALERRGLVTGAVRWAYVAVLLAIASLMIRELRDYLRWRSGPGTVAAPGGEAARPGPLVAALRDLRWRPLVSLPVSGIPVISAWVVVGVGLTTGFLAGFLGVGGGFIRVPAMLYVLGMPTRVAVGTDLLEILFSGTYGTFTYALKGRVDVMAAVLMLAGAAVGSQIGVFATCYARYRIRLYFAATMILTAVAVVLKQLGFETAAALLLFATAAAMSLLIGGILADGLWRRRRRPPSGSGRRQPDPLVKERMMER